MKITLPNSKEVVELKEFITGRDIESIEAPMQNLRMEVKDGKPVGEMHLGDAKRETVHKSIELIVMAVGDKTENILNTVLDLPAQDYKFILEEIDKIVGGVNFQNPEEKSKDGTN